MEMGRERLTKGLLLRFGLLSAAVLLCIHVYLETRWRGTPAVQMLAGPVRSSQDRRQHSRDQRDSAAPNRGVKSRVSYIRTLKRNGPAGRRDGDGEARPTPCCFPRRPRPKVTFHRRLGPRARCVAGAGLGLSEARREEGGDGGGSEGCC